MSDDPASDYAQHLEEIERRKRYERLTAIIYDPRQRTSPPADTDESVTG